ncbi:unnamed protein product, partial [Rotaria sp. Silwood2]
MGMTFATTCDYKNAYDYLLQALTIQEELLPSNHPDLV